MTRLHYSWFGLAAVVAVLVSCGADDNDVGEADGGAGGEAGSGQGGSPSGGGSSTGATGGSGGAVVPDPPGPGITCGETTCAEGTEMCCVAGPDRWCDENQCMGALARLECDDSADCPGEVCCFTNIMESNWVTTLCNSDCGMWDGVQVCKEASDCPNDEPCDWFVCGGLDSGTPGLSIGLCTSTAPWNCE